MEQAKLCKVSAVQRQVEHLALQDHLAEAGDSLLNQRSVGHYFNLFCFRSDREMDGDIRRLIDVDRDSLLHILLKAWGLCLGVGPLPELGFVGIAVGTALSHVAGCVAVLAVLVRGRYGLRLSWRSLWPDWQLQQNVITGTICHGSTG